MLVLTVFIIQAFQRDEITRKFHQITEQIEAALNEIPFPELDVSEEVREQVLFLGIC